MLEIVNVVLLFFSGHKKIKIQIMMMMTIVVSVAVFPFSLLLLFLFLGKRQFVLDRRNITANALINDLFLYRNGVCLCSSQYPFLPFHVGFPEKQHSIIYSVSQCLSFWHMLEAFPKHPVFVCVLEFLWEKN